MWKKILLVLLTVLLLLLIAGYAYYRIVIYEPPLISEEDRASVVLMPLPARMELGSGNLKLSEGLHLNDQSSNELVRKALSRFCVKVEKKTSMPISWEKGVKFDIICEQTNSAVPQFDEDESYTLKITKNKLTLQARTAFGILHGLETILQLIRYEQQSWIIPTVEIDDRPRFPWRGLMLDVCRHWIPKQVVLRVLDAMAAVKMNVFHWHLSEDQGFRVESKVFPNLHEIGSFGQYYTQEEIREVISYAAERGIRIVPEFDLPGHSKSWQIAYPELSSVDYALTFGTRKGEGFGPPIDPTKETVYEFLDQFIGEMSSLFPDACFHIGGDEVNPKYWQENINIQHFMEEHNMEDHHDLQAYFNRRMQAILSRHGKKMMGWDEILHPDLGGDVLVQSWRSHKSLFEAVQNGGTAILSSGYYLDHVLHAQEHYRVDPHVLEGAVDIEPDTTFWKMYDLKLNIGGNTMESQLVLFDRDTSSVFGFFAMLDSRAGFKNGLINGKNIQFKFQSPAGEMDYHGEFLGDSIHGKMSMGLFGIDASGIKIGGSDTPGTLMPKIEVMKPLTENEKQRIIGGEACQWSEFVDSTNIESRLWPRAAAIAEKLWSPQSLTKDIDDMYRRIQEVSRQLTMFGSKHDLQYRQKLTNLINGEGVQHLMNIADYLEEVKYHGRMGALLEADSIYLPQFPLDRVVDAVRPESMEARAFNELVNRYIESGEMDQKEAIIEHLKLWQYNHDLLEQYFSSSDQLDDIENISLELSVVSENLIALLDRKQATLSKEMLKRKLNFLEAGENGVILAVVPGLRNLLNNF